MDLVWNVLLSAACAVVATGLVFEVYALRTRRSGDTLPEHIRPWARRHTGLFTALCGALVAVGAWLPGHITG